MNKINYQKELEKTLAEIESRGVVPRLAMHVCCAPCSSYCMEYLTKYFDITCIYYNPNISPKEEFDKRINELKRLCSEMPFKNPVKVVEGVYENEIFQEIAKGLEDAPEGGARCHKCYRLRMENSARYAKENGYDFFTTTLTISPLKDSQVLNQIGRELSEKYDIPYLFSDFKKNNGFKRSIELSRDYCLYRQNFCGCEYSKPKVS